jgi:hypothetical protein
MCNAGPPDEQYCSFLLPVGHVAVCSAPGSVAGIECRFVPQERHCQADCRADCNELWSGPHAWCGAYSSGGWAVEVGLSTVEVTVLVAGVGGVVVVC